MTERDVEPVTIRILDKEFRVACPPEERESLLAAARYLNERMREVRDTGKVIGLDRIAVMAGLNVANELLRQQAREDRVGTTVLPRLGALQSRMQSLIDENRNVKIDF
ncbi:MAG: cell division protein ZapA [Gammaproteobacteria bacterium]|nr:cell division protein ZapA [Gammaproteobacteria bacterium]